jgi:diguanylate cyclase (GGDEF)-like protein
VHSCSDLGFISIWPARSGHGNGHTLRDGNLGDSAWPWPLRKANGERISSPVAGGHGGDDSGPCGGVSERQRAVEQARNLSVSDPLTGLANYRKLVDELDVEIKRCGRTGRSFAILLLDLEGLKTINDTQGHLSGNRALCRLARVLQTHCRSIDTAARHGGDEFALNLPEAERDAGLQVAQRVLDGLMDSPMIENNPPCL